MEGISMEEQRDDWDPRDLSVLADQRRAYDQMRERHGVAHSGFMGWSLFRHADIVEVLADPKTFSSASRHLAIPNGMDPPDHTRHRDALAPAFSEESMARLEARCRQIAVELTAAMIAAGEAELVADFAEPLALRTLCAFLGWPEELWECLGGWTHGNQQAAFHRDPAAGRALAKLITEHVQENLAEHRADGHAGDDITDALLATQVDGKDFTDEQIVSVLRNWIAGEGTVAAGISLLVLHLARDGQLQDRLRTDPSLIPGAIEEILRFDDPLVANRRTTTRDVEIGGRRIPAGETISLMWMAANRDSATFEAADEIRIERDTTDSLVWGQGIHLCQGAPLARLEMRVALEELLSRSRVFEVAGEVRRSVYPSDGLAEFAIRFR
jgi:cytochrome P450